MSSSHPIDREQVEEVAAQWVIRREEPDWTDADQRELDLWLSQSMAHKAAFWRLDHGWRQADRLRSLGDAVAPDRRHDGAGWWSGMSRPLAIAASIVFAVLASLTFFRTPDPVPTEGLAPQTIATAVGGHKRIPLADGSQIELNTATVLRAAVTAQSRVVWLDKGEAYFEVKHSDRVPFVVHAGPRTITVLGTKFSVRRDGDKVTVSVVQGRVRVDPSTQGSSGAAAPASSATVATGDIAIAEGASTLIAARTTEQVSDKLAWRDGMLTFDGSPLRDVAGEFNRYNERKLVIDDPEVATIRIGGTFKASNVDAFAHLLRDAYGLHVEADDKDMKISE